MAIKYLVFPGNIGSKNDNDIHYIDGKKLINLYGVDSKECVIVTTEKEMLGLRGQFTVLRPCLNGDYKIDKCAKIRLA